MSQGKVIFLGLGSWVELLGQFDDNGFHHTCTFVRVFAAVSMICFTAPALAIVPGDVVGSITPEPLVQFHQVFNF